MAKLRKPPALRRPPPTRHVDERWVRRVRLVGGAAVAALLIFTAVVAVLERRIPVELFPLQASPHLEDTGAQSATYDTDPPTSGPHFGSGLAPVGFYEQPLAPELLVHNLEDGGVVVYYRPDLPATAVAALRRLADGSRTKPGGLVAVPGKADGPAVTVTAWRRMMKLPEWNARAERQLNRFVDRFMGIDRHGENSQSGQ